MSKYHAVACPECKASAKFPCLRRSGATMKDDAVHPERVELWDRSKELAEALGL